MLGYSTERLTMAHKGLRPWRLLLFLHMVDLFRRFRKMKKGTVFTKDLIFRDYRTLQTFLAAVSSCCPD